jgi:hypothetical protein
MSVEIKGVVRYIGPVQKVGQKETEKQTIAIQEQDGEYPEGVVIEVWGEKCDKLKDLKVGDLVTAHYNRNVREWEGRWYQNNSLFKFDVGAAAPASTLDMDDPPF